MNNVFNFYTISYFAIITWVFLSLLFLFLHKGKSKRGWALLWLFLAAVIWLTFDLLSTFRLTSTYFSTLLSRAAFATGFSLSLLSLRFVFVVVEGAVNKITNAVIFVLTICIGLVTVFSDVIIIGVREVQYQGQSNFIPGSGYIFMMLGIILPLFFAFFYSLYSSWRTTDLELKKQLKYISIGLAFPAFIAPATNLILPFIGVDTLKLANVSVAVAITIFMYTVYKWQAFDVVWHAYTIRAKMTLSAVSQFLVVIAILGLVTSFVAIEIIENEVRNCLQSSLQSRTNHIVTYLEENTEKMKLVTGGTNLRKMILNYEINRQEEDRQQVLTIIKDTIEPIKDFEELSVFDRSGNLIASTGNKFTYNNFQDERFFTEGLDTESIYLVKEDGVQKIYLSGPFILDDQTIGVGLAKLKIDKLEKILEERVGLGETGELIAAFYNENRMPENLFPRRFENNRLNSQREGLPIQIALQGGSRVFNNILDYRGEPVIAASSYLPSLKIGLVAKIDRAEALAGIKKLFSLLLALAILFVIAYYYISKIIARFISKPIEKLQYSIEKIENGDLQYRAEIEGNDEIAEFSRVLNRTIDALLASRKEIDKKVKEQTKEIASRQQEMQDQQKAILNILEDVEEEKQEAELEQEKTEAILRSIGDGIVVTDKDGRVVIVNDATEKMFGYKIEEMQGHLITEVEKLQDENGKEIPLEKRPVVQALKLLKKSSNPVGETFYFVRKDKEKIPLGIVATPIVWEERIIGTVVVFRDLSIEHEIDKMKTEFVSVASHQLRTPLTAINWYIELLLGGDAGKLTEDQKKHLEEVYKGSKRMVRLVNDLLNVSRLETGRLKIEPKKQDLTKFIEDIIDEAVPYAAARNCKVKFTKPKKKIVSSVDPVLLRQVYHNLITNGIKYSKANKGKVEIKLGQEKKGDILFTVIDNGMGIPKKSHKRIFEKFFRADNAREQETEGTGLGLYVAKMIMEASGGKIWFESKQNKGTSFFVSIPKEGMARKKGEKGLAV